MKVRGAFFSVFVSIVVWIPSCIRDEAPNAEADIVSATIADEEAVLASNPVVGNSSVLFRLRRDTQNYHFAPLFTLTPGAIIEPASGTTLDFTDPQKYLVSSEDGRWQKEYRVSFVYDPDSGAVEYAYPFENVEIVKTESPVGVYHAFYEPLSNGQRKYDWSTANEGFNVLAATLLQEGEELTPEFYPTAQITDGYVGRAVKLQTKGTGPLGSLFGSPLAAGNLFLGSFELTIPAINATHFGIPYSKTTPPIAITGYFKYKAGGQMTITNPPSSLTSDTWDAYAILFEATQNGDDYLTGTHQFKDPRIISLARIDKRERIQADNWTPFEIPFKMLEGKVFDPSKEYKITIVFSSSLEGDLFNGAIGSTLWIDEVKIVTE